MVALGLALTAAPAEAAVGLLATKGRHLVVVHIGSTEGLLTSISTRIPGLIAADDLTHRARLGVLHVPDAAARVARLETRFEQIHAARRWAYALLAGLPIAAILIALRLRTGFTRRFCVAIAPTVLAVNLLLGLAGAARPEVVLPLLGLGSVALAATIALPRRLVLWLGPAVLLLFLVVLWAWPETAGFAAIGPRPEQGSRFYGINNMNETVLLTIALFSAAELGLASVLPIAALGFVTLGLSRAGADGGGLIVFAGAFAFLALRLWGPLTWRRLALAAAAGIVVVLAFVGADAASGGHNHVTRAFEKGPGGWFGDIGHRIHSSVDGLNSGPQALMFAVSIVALAWLGFRRLRYAALDALLVGLLISFVVNDTAREIAPAGAISGFVLWTWTVTRYTRARALGHPDPDRGGPSGGRLRKRGPGQAAPRDGDRDDSDPDHGHEG